ncbi:hypothetical protein SARC_01904, partial [Sphaeroforma arctica JP610]
DLVTDLLLKFYGEERASERWTITALDVPENVQGVMKLLQNKCFRAAVDFTGIYLKSLSAGVDAKPDTPETLQMMLVRLSSLSVLGLWEKALHTLDVLGDLGRYGIDHESCDQSDRASGSSGPVDTLPFALHLLAGVVPFKAGHEHDALDHIYGLWHRVREQKARWDGKQGSEEFLVWEEREEKVAGVLVWILVQLNEFQLALDILSALPEPSQARDSEYRCRVGAYRLIYRARVHIAVGDITAATDCTNEAEALTQPLLEKASAEDTQEASIRTLRVDLLINKGNLLLSKGSFNDALKVFLSAQELAPNDTTVVNNLGVAYVYLGRLSESIATSKALLNEKTARNEVPPSQLVLNLSTMHELESSRSAERKQDLIPCVENITTDSYPVQALKI